jgi:hypothetical protein
MPYTVDFNTVSTVGLESSPVAAALAGLRANTSWRSAWLIRQIAQFRAAKPICLKAAYEEHSVRPGAGDQGHDRIILGGMIWDRC